MDTLLISSLQTILLCLWLLEQRRAAQRLHCAQSFYHIFSALIDNGVRSSPY